MNLMCAYNSNFYDVQPLLFYIIISELLERY